MPTRLRILRSRPLRVAALVLVAAAWLYLAPTQIGGSTSYVATRGTSMEPRFHTGDLALLRPAGSYRVGDVVGYRSSALRTVVLHRVIGRQGDRYVFKGDNNNFIDPIRPRRRDLVGKLWIRTPRGGLVLAWVHSPGGAALLAGGVALLMLVGGDRRRRRRGRRGKAGAPPSPHPPRHPFVLPFPRALPGLTPARVLRAAAGAAVAFLVLGLLAFSRPASRP